MTQYHYQLHIDGIRALAVILVLLHHLGDWGALTGGYVGVDVFFVISGYLITRIIKAELYGKNFTFSGFYKRRIIRLAPAYVFILLFTSLAGFVFFLPAELLRYAETLVSSTFFVANVHMWREIGGYFGVAAETTPLLHLWSFAIEEQFYFLWPLLLFLGYKYLSHGSQAVIIFVFVIIGILFSEFGVQNYPAAAYYLLPTRVFELAFGALLAYFKATRLPDSFRSLLSCVGLILVLFAAYTFNKETRFPGYLGVIPVLGAGLLLRYGSVGTMGRILRFPLFTLVGKISYPIYLWHWPIISFLHLSQVKITWMVGGVIISFVIGVSWLTYRYIEIPFRRFLMQSSARAYTYGLIVPITAFTVLAYLIIATQGFPLRFPETLNVRSNAILSFPNISRGRCNEGNPTNPLPPTECILGRAMGQVDFLLVGDSHANHFTGFFDEIGKDANLRGFDMTRSQTVFLPGVEFWTMREGEAEPHKNFVPRNQYISKLLSQEKYKFIVMAGAWSSYFSAGTRIRHGNLRGEEAFKEGMRSAIRVAQAASETVIIIKMVPSLKPTLFDCTLQNERFGRSRECTIPIEQHIEKEWALEKFFKELEAQFPRVVWIDPTLLTCLAGRCLTEINGIPLYRDNTHLNDKGSRLLALEWIVKFGNPLAMSVR